MQKLKPFSPVPTPRKETSRKPLTEAQQAIHMDPTVRNLS